MTPEMCRFTASHYVGDNDPRNPLLSPVNAEMSGLPPLCIHAGDNDLLLSDSVRFAERALAYQVEVELHVWPGMWHAFQASARFVPEARQSLEAMGRFVEHHLTRSTPREG
jgi:acetyl esterase/lipase